MGDIGDLAAIRHQLEIMTVQLEVLVSRVETRIPLVDGFDDRLARAERIEKSLASAALKLAATKALSSWVPGAIAGGIAGAAAAWILLSAGIAGAH